MFGRLRRRSEDGMAASDDAETARREALRLIDEGNAIEDAGRLDVAMERYDAAIRLSPTLPRAHVNRGNVLLASGDAEGALAAYQQALEYDPRYAAAHLNMGNTYARRGETRAALEAYRSALALEPGLAAGEVGVGCMLDELGRGEEAIVHYRRALELDPHLAETHFNLGAALAGLGQLDDAATSLRRAAELRPGFVAALFARGNVLQELLQLDLAVSSYREALAADPRHADAHFGLGNVLAKQGRLEEALASHRSAIAIRPDHVEAHNNAGALLRDLGRFEESLASIRRALELRPDFAEAHSNLGNALDALLRPGEAEASYRRSLELRPDFAPAHHNLLFCLSEHEGDDPVALFAEHRRFAERFERPLRERWPQHHNRQEPSRPLQVGFVSADFRNHAVAHFIEPILDRLAIRTGLVLHAYYSHAIEDEITSRLRRHFKHWHAIAGLSDDALATKVAADGIDILIDLSGHTAGNRLLTFARKPAPVQASWIGYPGTTGLQAMDYYFADPHFLPPGKFDGQFTEKLVRLPANAPFLPARDAPPVNALPALQNGWVTLGSFNRITKLSRTAVSLWSGLLRARPDTRMLIGGMPADGRQAQLIEWFAAEGIAPERMEFHPRCSTAEYLALHHRVDLCLDAFPYTGGTTTSHALWMGVPTLTLAGLTPPGRQGAALLGQVGLDQFVASDASDFVRKGTAWIDNPTALAAVRAELRARCDETRIREPDVIASAFDRALRIMWERWCTGLPAETIDVSGDPAAA